MGLVLYLMNGADGLGTVAISAAFLPTVTAAAFLLIGAVCLLIQRIRKSGREKSKKQLVTGCGFLAYAAMTAAVCTSVSVILDAVFGYETVMCFIAQCVMCIGGWLCFLFFLPILRSYKAI